MKLLATMCRLSEAGDLPPCAGWMNGRVYFPVLRFEKKISIVCVLAGSSSHGGAVAVYVFDLK